MPGQTGRRVLAVLAAASALAFATTSALAAGPAPAAAAPRWRTVSLVPGPLRTALLGVATAGLRHAWAVGLTAPPRRAEEKPVIEAWNGSAWSRLPVPATVTAKLESPILGTITATGPHSVWAFGLGATYLHFDGVRWTVQRLPGTFAQDAQASLAVGTSTIWTFGGKATGGKVVPTAAYRTGSGGWRRTPVPGSGSLAAASAVSPHDIWAVLGTNALELTSVQGAGLVHWNGVHWQAVPSLPAPLLNRWLGAVLARGDSDVWVGGAIKNAKGGSTEAVGHWTGSGWTVQVLPAPTGSRWFHVISMTGDGSGGIWALGACTTGRCDRIKDESYRLWHETGGHWSSPVQPKALGRAGLYALAGAGRLVWAVGSSVTGPKTSDGLIARWGIGPR